jgi:OHCU decarboxylase
MMKEVSKSLAALNALPQSEFMALLGDIVEHSPWVAERAFAKKPFSSLDDLNAKLIACIRDADAADRLALFNRHPELAGREAAAGEMTESSTSEQGRLGLMCLPAPQHQRLTRINRNYRTKFGFPFIAALRLHGDLESVMREGEASLNNTFEAEVERTLRQISAIVYGRLTKIFP